MKMITKLIFTTLFAAVASLGAVGVSFAQQQSTNTESIRQGELEQILAPIALYPDTVLSHILIAATYPLEVIQAERWTLKNPELQGSEAVEAVNDKDWDPSVRALVAFPDILQRLSEDLDWTQQLGDAFLQDEQQVLASVQTLRQQAYQAGSLDEMDKAAVTHDEGAIVIESHDREVVYLPYYDSRVVYGAWHWSHYPPVYWDYPYRNHYAGRRHGSFLWGPRIDISFGFHFSSFHWGNRHIVRIPYQHYRPRNHYNHRQIVKHDQARRWAHNPRHRRGVAYRGTRSNQHFQHQLDHNQRSIRKTQTRLGDIDAPVVKPKPIAKGQFRPARRNNRLEALQRSQRGNVVKIQQPRTVHTKPLVNRTTVPTNPVVGGRNAYRSTNRQVSRSPNAVIRPQTTNRAAPVTIKSQSSRPAAGRTQQRSAQQRSVQQSSAQQRPVQQRSAQQRPVQQRPAAVSQRTYKRAESRSKQESKSAKTSAKPRSSRPSASKGEQRRQPR